MRALVALAGGVWFEILACLAARAKVSVGAVVAMELIVVASGIYWFLLLRRFLRARGPASAPAVLDEEGFTLTLDKPGTKVPWRHVYKLVVFEQPLDRSTNPQIVLSLAAILYRDSPYRQDRMVQRYMAVLWRRAQPCVWLGELSTARPSTASAFAAAEDWLGTRFDSRPQSIPRI